MGMIGKKILLINCGGTIGMIKTKSGYATKKGFFAEYVRNNRNLNIAQNDFVINTQIKSKSTKFTESVPSCNNIKNHQNNIPAHEKIDREILKNTNFNTTIESKMQEKICGICYKKQDLDKCNNINLKNNVKDTETEHIDRMLNQNHKVFERQEYRKIINFYAVDTPNNINKVTKMYTTENKDETKQNNIVNFTQSVQDKIMFERKIGVNVEKIELFTNIAHNKMYIDNDYMSDNDLIYRNKKLNLNNINLYITPTYIKYEIIELEEILDSANAQLQNYHKILQVIKLHYNNYSGFVILHGTDTMTFASSFISSMIKNLTKPIVFTGSTTPMTVNENEGVNNILKSIKSARDLDRGVFVQFGNLLCDGTKITKVSVDNENAFIGSLSQSFSKSRFGNVFHCNCNENLVRCKPNTLCNTSISKNHTMKSNLGQINGNFSGNIHIPSTETDVLPTFYDKFDDRIAIIKIYPNIKKCIFEALVKNHCAIILETFGTGNGLGKCKEILEILENYIKEGNLVVNVSQCVNGYVTDEYEANMCLSRIGVISGRNMTSDALFCHLARILANCSLNDAKNEILDLINN